MTKVRYRAARAAKNKRVHPLFSFGPFKSVKRLQNASKTLIFKNWLDTCHKNETHEPKLYPTILGGVSPGFWTPFLDLGALSAVFWHMKTGNFAKSARFQVPNCANYSHSSSQVPSKKASRKKKTSPPNCCQYCHKWKDLFESTGFVLVKVQVGHTHHLLQ